MNPILIIALILIYFLVLVLISRYAANKDTNNNFFTGNKQSPWYVVAFGMIGASLSGVTFISVPGWVETSSFSYMQMVMGYFFGYLVVIFLLLPLYYKLNLTSIYQYLNSRFGKNTYKTGASLFIVSRLIGAAFRLYLVANVLQLIVFNPLGIPFFVTVSITIALIWMYTFRSGIQAIVWTDTLQTFFMIASVVIVIILIMSKLEIPIYDFFSHIDESKYSKIFFFEDSSSPNYFWKQFLSGIFITIVMTGLDQDMMQKNLTCKTLRESQKNMFWMSTLLFVVNFFFLSVGILLMEYSKLTGITAHADNLFPTLAMQSNLGFSVSILFILGLIAAAYSSADSALTSLTTSISVDIFEIEKTEIKKSVKTRKIIHLLVSISLGIIVVIFGYIIDENVIKGLLTFAGYSYGPLLGLYSFGLFTQKIIYDKLTPVISIASPLISYIVKENSMEWFGYNFGFELLIFNGAVTFVALYISAKIYRYKNNEDNI